jgi:hypothetical protein
MRSLPAAFRHLFRDNPLCGRDGIARRRHGVLRIWWCVAWLILASGGVTYLVYLGPMSGAPTTFQLFVMNALAPHIAAPLIALVLLTLVPRGQNLRSVLAELRLAGLTPGQISMGHLLRAGQALVRFQLLWLGAGVALAALLPEVHRGFPSVLWTAEDGGLFRLIVLGSALNPWLMLVLAWAALVRWGNFLAAAAVTISAGLLLNPVLFFFALLGVLRGTVVAHPATFEFYCLLLRVALVLGALAWVSRRFDAVIAGER